MLIFAFICDIMVLIYYRPVSLDASISRCNHLQMIASHRVCDSKHIEFERKRKHIEFCPKGKTHRAIDRLHIDSRCVATQLDMLLTQLDVLLRNSMCCYATRYVATQLDMLLRNMILLPSATRYGNMIVFFSMQASRDDCITSSLRQQTHRAIDRLHIDIVAFGNED